MNLKEFIYSYNEFNRGLQILMEYATDDSLVTFTKTQIIFDKIKEVSKEHRKELNDTGFEQLETETWTY